MRKRKIAKESDRVSPKRASGREGVSRGLSLKRASGREGGKEEVGTKYGAGRKTKNEK